ncbi:DUF1634 domain-containing protein [Methanomassiliicoccus luminyensis]|jgi:uncharacterized membrane protein|uniref:DUF1634 domain-containing protein n=1 Tax=Methanomassiliicoccus luminyensis TaxID=1080712 RepID=UPI0003767977|nr:DUF1634 domain-containing protein [Methanomassiliicoccus luminyensis]
MDEHAYRHTRLNRWTRLVLEAGMVLSVATLVLGLVLFALSPVEHQEVDMTLGEIASGIMEGNPIAVLDLGIIFLIATPLTRVVAALIVFISDREPRYVLVSLAVLALIGLAVLTG